MHEPDEEPGEVLDEGNAGKVGGRVLGKVSVIADEDGDSEQAGVDEARPDEEAGGRDVEEVGLEGLEEAVAFALREGGREREGERERERERVCMCVSVCERKREKERERERKREKEREREKEGERGK